MHKVAPEAETCVASRIHTVPIPEFCHEDSTAAKLSENQHEAGTVMTSWTWTMDQQ